MKTLYEIRQVLDQEERPMRLEYYLLSEEEEHGVEIVMRRGVTVERQAVRNVTSSPSGAEKLLWLLAARTVTPCTLLEVLQEVLE